MPLLPVDTPRSVWLAERRRGIGGSDALAVMGLSDTVSPYEVWADKLNLLPAKAESDPMTFGKLLEPAIANYFADTQGLRVRRAGMFAHPEHPWMRFTPNRLTNDGGILEIRTTAEYHTSEWADDHVPATTEARVRHGMAVLNRGHTWVIGLIGGQHPVIRRVERDRAIEANLVALEHAFWHNHVLPRQPPAPDGSGSCTRTLAEIYREVHPDRVVELDEHDMGVLTKLAVLKEQARQLQQSTTELENWLKHRLGHAEIGRYGGRPVVHLREHHRTGYTVGPVTYRQLHLLRKENRDDQSPPKAG